jgi:predicted ATP-dependent endonuclease of OLD family
MIKLKSLEIQAYRSCVDTKINLDSDITALIGINGSGKSNIMNALLLLKKTFNWRYGPSYKLRSDANNKSKIKVAIEYESKMIYITGEIIFETDEHNYDEVIGVNLKWDLSALIKEANNIILPSLFYSYGVSEGLSNYPAKDIIDLYRHPYDKEKLKKLDKKNITILEKSLPHIRNIITFFDSIRYYSASQFSDPSKCPNYIEIEADKPRTYRLRRSNVGHERFILDLYLSWKNTNPEFQNYLGIINNTGIGLLNNISFKEVPMPSTSYEVLLGGNVKTIEKSRVIIVPIFNIGKNKLSPNQLSEGTLRALSLIFYILTDNSNLLLLEEPEVCVHHGLLNSIIELLKSQSRQKQVVISTHSDYILDQLNPENLILVTREANLGTKANTLPEVMAKNDYDALKTYLKESGNLGEYWKSGGLE